MRCSTSSYDLRASFTRWDMKRNSLLALFLIFAAAAPAQEASKPQADKGTGVSEEIVQKHIAQLDDDSFSVREEAVEKLKELGPAAEKTIRKALASKPSPEAQRRLRDVLAAITHTFDGDFNGWQWI